MMKGLVVLILFFCMAGCTNKGAGLSGILDKEKMQAVMWDVIGADVFTEQFIKKDSSKNAAVENMQLQNKIFTIHNVSREEFYKSYDYYVEHTNLMKTMLDSMTTRAERNRSEMMQRQAEEATKMSKQLLDMEDSIKRLSPKRIIPFFPENRDKDFSRHLPIGFLKND